mgnify:CR=1 FL=1
MCGELEDRVLSSVVTSYNKQKCIRVEPPLDTKNLVQWDRVKNVQVLKVFFSFCKWLRFWSLQHHNSTRPCHCRRHLMSKLQPTCIFCRRHIYRTTFLFSRLLPRTRKLILWQARAESPVKRFPSEIFWWEMAPESNWQLQEITEKLR